MILSKLERCIKHLSSHNMDKKPIKGEYLEILLRSPQTVFSTKDASLLWNENDKSIITDRLKSYVKVGKLVRLRYGLYAKDKNYNHFELATRINTPSYISFETVLGSSGITFQYYGNIFVASYLNREMEVDGQKIKFIRMKDYVLSNILGIENSDGYSRATKERAYLDRIYISKEYYFDNLNSLNWDKVFEILPIYHNKRMEKAVRKQYNEFNKLNK